MWSQRVKYLAFYRKGFPTPASQEANHWMWITVEVTRSKCGLRPSERCLTQISEIRRDFSEWVATHLGPKMGRNREQQKMVDMKKNYSRQKEQHGLKVERSCVWQKHGRRTRSHKGGGSYSGAHSTTSFPRSRVYLLWARPVLWWLHPCHNLVAVQAFYFAVTSSQKSA